MWWGLLRLRLEMLKCLRVWFGLAWVQEVEVSALVGKEKGG